MTLRGEASRRQVPAAETAKKKVRQAVEKGPQSHYMRQSEQSAKPGTKHYFSAQPEAASRPVEITWRLPDRTVRLQTDRGTFSHGHVDRGTDLLARTMELPAQGEILDLGAGYGPLGIVAALRSPQARVTLVEVNERAAELARRNQELNAVGNAEVLIGDAPEVLGERRFLAVVTNPPMHAGKQAVYRLLEDAARRLVPGGSLWLVAQTKQGAKSLVRDLGRWFAQVEVVERGGGFRVIRARTDEAQGGDES